MIKIVSANIVRFFFLILLQALVLNNVGLYNMVNPYLYILFIILLPFETPMYLVLSLSFFMGLSIDAFSNTGGMHAAASTFIAFVRQLILLLITPRGGYEHQLSPNLRNMGTPWFLTYASSMVFLHHFVLFNIEIFRLSELLITLSRTLFSSIFTLILIMLSQYLLGSPKKR